MSGSLLSLLAGILLLGNTVWQLTGSGAAPLLPIISGVLAVVLIAVAIIGLVSPRLRDR